jgi:hypothetical protein
MAKGLLVIRQLPSQGFEVDHESANAFSGKSEEKVSPIQVSQLSCTLLGDSPLRIPMNGRRKPKLSGQLVGRAAQGRTDFCGYSELDSHLRDLKP